MMICSLVFAPVAPSAFAAKIIIQRTRIVRLPTPTGELQVDYARVGKLTKGSIVEIPDEFVKAGRSLNVSINEWLKAGVQHRPKAFKKGDVTYTKNDVERIVNGSAAAEGMHDGDENHFFFPVKIVHAANQGVPGGSSFKEVIPADSILQIELSQLVSQGGARFATQADLDLIKKKEAPGSKKGESKTNADPAAVNKPKAESETQAAAPPPTCTNCLTEKNPILAMKADLASAFAKSDASTLTKEQQFNGNRLKVASMFKQKCGMEFADFEKEMAADVGHDIMMLELLKTIIVNESAGKGLCTALNENDPKGGSWGLFQVNAESSSSPACLALSPKEGALKKNVNAAETNSDENFKENYRQCKAFNSNPRNSLRDAIRILKEKSKELFAGQDPIFDVSKMSKADQTRVLLSAYNGGSTYIRAAKLALLKFNAKNGTHLSAERWEDLRLMYFRIYISKDKDPVYWGAKKYVYNKETGKSGLALEDRQRNKELTLSNLAYVESAVPRAPNNSSINNRLHKMDGTYMALESTPE